MRYRWWSGTRRSITKPSYQYSNSHYTVYLYNENPHAWKGRLYIETGRCSNLFGALQWHHNESDGASKHQPPDCLLSRLFSCRSKKTSKLRVTGLCAGNSPGTGDFPAQKPVTRKMFPFDGVIMNDMQVPHRWYKAVIQFLIQTTPQVDQCSFNLRKRDITKAPQPRVSNKVDYLTEAEWRI